MERITLTQLNAVMRRMAEEMGAPNGPVWTRDENGRNKATIGALVLDQGSATYGNAWAISQIVNEGGGQKTLLQGRTARELWDVAQGWLAGFSAARGAMF